MDDDDDGHGDVDGGIGNDHKGSLGSEGHIRGRFTPVPSPISEQRASTCSSTSCGLLVLLVPYPTHALINTDNAQSDSYMTVRLGDYSWLQPRRSAMRPGTKPPSRSPGAKLFLGDLQDVQAHYGTMLHPLHHVDIYWPNIIPNALY